MTPQTFLENIEDAFGPKRYSDTMRSAIKTILGRNPGSIVAATFKAVMNHHERQGLPVLANIRAYCEMDKVPLMSRQKMEYRSVCEHCGQNYSVDDYYCPTCGSIREDGVLIEIDPAGLPG